MNWEVLTPLGLTNWEVANTLCIQKEIQKKSLFNNTTKYVFPLIKYSDIDFLCIQNLNEYF